MMFEKTIGQKPGDENLHAVCSLFGSSISQSIERGRISQEGALDVREGRERRDKILPTFSPEKQQKNGICWREIFHVFERRIAYYYYCVFGDESIHKIGMTEFPIKNSQKRRRTFLVSEILSKSGCASLDIFIMFLAAEKLFGGGGITSKLVSQ